MNVLWALFQLRGRPVLQALEKQGVTITTLGQLLARPLQNGVFKKPDNVGRGHKLINVYDLYADTTVDLDAVESLEVTADEVERYAVAVGDVFFTRSSLKPEGIAWAAYLDRCNEAAVFECHIIRARLDQSKVVPGFLTNYARSWIARQYLIARAGVTTMATIDQGGVEELPIVLPAKAKQIELLAALDTARATRRAKLAEADALLAGLDDFLLTSLGLTPPLKGDRKIFAATLQEVRGRADADFHSPRFRAIREGIETGKYPAEALSVLCTRFESGFAAGKQDQAFDYTVGVPHLRPLNLSAEGELTLDNTKFVPKSVVSQGDYCVRNEVLFNNTNSAEMVGKADVFVFDQPCACSNHITRLQAAPGVSPYYLAAVFNMYRRFGYFSLLATKFNNQAGINLDTLRPLRVPAPPSTVQDTIATEARRRREEARRLRAEAEVAWQQAKQWFEEQLLGPAQS